MNKRMTLEEKRIYLIDTQTEVIYNGVNFTPSSFSDLDCKFCGKSLKIIYGDKSGLFKVKGCGCRGHGNRKYFESVFGEEADCLWVNSTDAIRKERSKGRFSFDWFKEKYGNDLGLAKYQEFLDYSRQDEESFKKRYGEEGGLKRFEQFKERSRNTFETFVQRYGEEGGKKRWGIRVKNQRERGTFGINWWIDKCNGDEEDALRQYTKFQTRDLNWHTVNYGEELGKEKFDQKCQMHSWSNSLARYIEDFGVEEGSKIFRDIQRRRQINRVRTTTSLPAKALFKEIDRLLIYGETSVWQKEENKREYSVSTLNMVYFVDYVIPELKLIVEFNGDYWHMNPSKYKLKDINQTKGKTAAQIWQEDHKKIKAIEAAGFKCLLVWESDYKRDSISVIDSIHSAIKRERDEIC